MMNKQVIIISTLTILTAACVAMASVVISNSENKTNPALPKVAIQEVDFDAEQMQLLGEIVEGEQRTIAAALSGSVIAVFSKSFEELVRFKTPHESEISALCASGNEGILISADKGGSVCVWDLAKKRVVMLNSVHKSEISDIKISEDGTKFATASRDRTVIVRDTSSLEAKFVLKGHSSYVSGIDFSPDGSKLASVGLDNKLVIWNCENGSKIKERSNSHYRAVNSVRFSKDGKQLITSSADKMIKVWNAENLEPIHSIKGHVNEVLAISYNVSGTLMFSAGRDGFLYVYDASSGERMGNVELKNNVYSSGILSDPDFDLVYVADRSGDITCIDAAAMNVRYTATSDSVNAISFL